MRLKLTNSHSHRRRAARYLLALTAVAVPASLVAGPAAATAHAPRPIVAKHVQARAAHPAPAGSHTFAGLGAGQSDLLQVPPDKSGGGDDSGAGNCSYGVCYSPPDVNIAAGPGEVIETVNCTIAAYSKNNGTQLWQADLRTLFPGDDICTDPRVIFIPWIGKFAISYWDGTSDNLGPVRFALSNNNTPGGTASSWLTYATPSGFLDQPKIVATRNTLVVSADDYNNIDEQYYVYDLNQVANGTANPAMQAVTGGLLPAWGAVGEGSQAPPNGYFLSAGGNNVFLQTVSGDPATGPVSVSTQTLPNPQAISFPSEPAVPGGNIGGGKLDNRVVSAVYEVQNSNNHPVIDFSGTAECSGNVTCPYDIKLDMTTSPPTIVKDVQISPAGSGQSYSYGSVALDNSGNAYLAYSASDANDTPSAAVLSDNGSGATTWNSVIQADTPGTTSCTSDATPPCDERWGDYFGAAQDPTNTSDVWVASEYQAGSGLWSWGTAIAEVNASGITG